MRQSRARLVAARVSWPGNSSNRASSRSNRVRASAVPPAVYPTCQHPCNEQAGAALAGLRVMHLLQRGGEISAPANPATIWPSFSGVLPKRRTFCTLLLKTTSPIETCPSAIITCDRARGGFQTTPLGFKRSARSAGHHNVELTALPSRCRQRTVVPRQAR